MSSDIEDPESIGQGTVVLSDFRYGSVIERGRIETCEIGLKMSGKSSVVVVRNDSPLTRHADRAFH